MMRNPERANTVIANTIGILGCIMMCFFGGLYFFLRDAWQIIFAFIGVGLMAFSLYADN